MAEEPKEFMNTDELAEWLGVPGYTVAREAREGRLPGRKVGRGWRFSRTAILAHFAGSDAGRSHITAPSPTGSSDGADATQPPDPT